MNRGILQRKKLYVSRRIQGQILLRVAVYWTVYHIALWVIISWDQFLLSVGESLTTAGGAAAPQTAYGAFFLYSALGCAVALVPLVLWDILKVTHRVAGPLIRLQNVLEQMARGERVEEIRFRKGDMLVEVEDAFNKYLDSINRRKGDQAKKESGSPSDETDQDLSTDVETIVGDLEELSRAAQTGSLQPPERDQSQRDESAVLGAPTT